MKRPIILVSILLCIAAFSFEASAQSRTRVKFAKGTHGATVKGTVRGFAYRDYLVGASAGQTMDLKLTATNGATIFSVFVPGGENLEGAAQMDEFTGELPRSGDYVVRVGMMRAEARRPGSVSSYTLKITVQ